MESPPNHIKVVPEAAHLMAGIVVRSLTDDSQLKVSPLHPHNPPPALPTPWGRAIESVTNLTAKIFLGIIWPG